MKKKIIFKNIIFISIITFLCTGFLSVANAEELKKGTVTLGKGFNVRSEASLDSKIISVLKPESPVELVEESGAWYKIKIGTAYGYILKEFVKPDAAKADSSKPATQPETAKTSKGTVLTKNGLNLRESADAKSKILEALKPGTIVEIIETKDSWCKVKADEYTGYVSKCYIKPDETTKQEVQSSDAADTSENNILNGIVLAKNGLNLRSEADLKSKVISVIKLNTPVQITEENDGWYKIKVNNLEGYVSKQFIKVQ